MYQPLNVTIAYFKGNNWHTNVYADIP